MNCKKIISDFIKDKLEGDINKFIEYDFAKLKGSYYGKCNKGSFDPDNTVLCNRIMYLIFENSLPNLVYSEIGTGKNYRGDTIHTIKKLFSKKERENICSNPDIKKYEKLHHTIGNFMLLPNSGEGKDTLNCVRSGKLKDVFPWFINDLNAFFIKEGLVDYKIAPLFEKNDWYFGKIKSAEKFCEVNWLDKTSMDSIVSYRDFIKENESCVIKLKMLREFNKMIESRSKKIIVKLKELL